MNYANVDWMSPPRSRRPAVLIIEAEPRERFWLADALTSARCRVAEAGTSEEAIQLVQSQVFQAITLGLLQSAEDVGAVLLAIRGSVANAGTPVVIVLPGGRLSDCSLPDDSSPAARIANAATAWHLSALIQFCLEREHREEAVS
jgi:CheY-like chemotaxis protein